MNTEALVASVLAASAASLLGAFLLGDFAGEGGAPDPHTQLAAPIRMQRDAAPPPPPVRESSQPKRVRAPRTASASPSKRALPVAAAPRTAQAPSRAAPPARRVARARPRTSVLAIGDSRRVAAEGEAPTASPSSDRLRRVQDNLAWLERQEEREQDLAAASEWLGVEASEPGLRDVLGGSESLLALASQGS
jgi:hypothetical protein